MSIFALETDRKVPQKQGWSVNVSKAMRTVHIHKYAREGGRSLPQIRSDHRFGLDEKIFSVGDEDDLSL